MCFPCSAVPLEAQVLILAWIHLACLQQKLVALMLLNLADSLVAPGLHDCHGVATEKLEIFVAEVWIAYVRQEVEIVTVGEGSSVFYLWPKRY